MDNITMNRAEREQLDVFNRLKRGEIQQKEAAVMLGFSDRWVRAKYKRYLHKGDKGIVHQGRGLASPKRLSDDLRAKALSYLKLPDWTDFGPTFAKEKLAEQADIVVSKDSVRQLMIKHGLWKGIYLSSWTYPT